MDFGALTRACTVGISTVVLLSGCTSTVPGSAVRAKSATPLDVTPLKESQLDDVLLSIDQLDDLVGATEMAFVHQSDDMSDNSTAVSDPECLGSLFGAEKGVYDTHHWTAMRDEVAREPGDGNDHWVQQTVVLYLAADIAQKLIANAAKK